MHNDIEKLKEFLSFLPYRVLHETCSLNKNIEHYFMIIHDDKISDDIIKKCFKSYAKVYPVINLSSVSMDYKKENDKDFHFLFLDSLNKTNSSYLKNKLFIEENANNILSIRMINEPVDIPKHISNKIDTYKSEIHDLSLGASLIAKDAILTGIIKGKELYKEKSPQIQKKANQLGNSISNKLIALRKKF